MWPSNPDVDQITHAEAWALFPQGLASFNLPHRQFWPDDPLVLFFLKADNDLLVAYDAQYQSCSSWSAERGWQNMKVPFNIDFDLSLVSALLRIGHNTVVADDNLVAEANAARR